VIFIASPVLTRSEPGSLLFAVSGAVRQVDELGVAAAIANAAAQYHLHNIFVAKATDL
jgi:hypothetical protein